MEFEPNKTEIPDWVHERALQRRGKAFVSDDMDPRHTALVVVDLQNCFMMDGVAHALVTQARAIVQGVRVGAADRARVLLVDSSFRVIASSDGQGILTERVPLNLEGRRCGFYQDRAGTLVAFHATPGYETYKGLGWYGVITGAAG